MSVVIEFCQCRTIEYAGKDTFNGWQATGGGIMGLAQEPTAGTSVEPSADGLAAVLAQSVLSFLFNAAIIGMSINIAAGLIGN